MGDIIRNMVETSGFAGLTWRHLVMILIALLFIYLAIFKEYEPYLLLPIAFGILLVNLPFTGIFAGPANGEPGGLLYYLYQGTNLGIYPPLIFLCLGAATDFGPLIANPKTLLLGAAAQFGIFAAFFGAIFLGLTGEEAASVGIIGGADGPTAIYLTTRLAPHLLSVIAIAAYSYMALVPIIQPPIINALTTERERKIKMTMKRTVTKKERILFPIFTTIFVSLVVPAATTLIGCLMLGNLIRESQVVPKITETLQNAMMYIVTIILGLTVGAKAEAEIFLSATSLKIIFLGLAAFAIGTATGVLFGKVMCKLTKGQINPMIGAAGVSAVPMAARVVHKEGLKNDPSNYLLMHAMGPNVAGIIGSAIAAGTLLAFFS
ncbi:sodium ion-translocating decarboxylase subunit beta [Enterococcus diestrammenae]|uniref:Oxaloacetate decarboxylase, beta subunit n=1 Tax=Enterococcus diestrammenae TaxID=1155073 RepID=A0ABV0F4A1_9ENTE|nr:sodium ion-translocating decarboxylase subunit beta [Enterococcus diestrammenae]KAF1300432.1 glutaconyl-CoA decarboxylase subunit beta [Enterococcus diestrammenae]HIX70082.1 sodium ion-translocating decarboxylase subunit beta [Candidatus Enterococcus stercoravium]